MRRSAAEAEAVGEQFVAATYNGAEFRLPLDVDLWPLDAILNCRTIDEDRLTVDHRLLIGVLERLLGRDQMDLFAMAAPTRRDHVPASHVFAEAVGMGKAIEESDIVFGGLPRLLTVLELWPDKVESDLDRFWGIDYRDRWRTRRGRRKLTLRQIYTRLSNLPPTSALAVAMNRGKIPKSGEELVLMDLFEVVARRRHPSRPMSAAEAKVREAEAAAEEKAKEQHHARMDARNRKLAAPIENAYANARRAQQREVTNA